MIIDEAVYLEHFGVKGQRWGVRNEDKQGRRDARAQKFTTKAEGFQKQIDTLNNRTSTNSFQRHRINKQTKDLGEKKAQALLDAEAKRQGKLSHRQKTVVKGAVAAGVILAAYGTYSMSQSGETNRIAMRGKAFLSGNGVATFKKDARLAAPDMTPEAIMAGVVRPINPDYGKIGTKMNCRRATFAYEMRRRGYDVAATKTTNGRGQNIAGLINAETTGKDLIGPNKSNIAAHLFKEQRRGGWTPLTKAIDEGKTLGKHNIVSGDEGGSTLSHSIFRTLAKQPNGSRGELGVTWQAGGGHSLAYEIIKGKPVIFDTQSGKMFSDDIDLASGFASHISTAAFSRLDNVQLNQSFLMRWMKNA